MKRRRSDMSGTITSAVWTMAWLAAATLAAALVPRQAAASPKVDVVYMNNGDRVTCEVKRLHQGNLAVSTDTLDGASLHWGMVVGLTSPREFEVTVESGDRYYGSLGRSAVAGELVVTSSGAPAATLRLAEVIALVPIGASLWRRMDGGVDVGLTFAQANLESHWAFNGNATYRSKRYLLSSSLASQLTARADADKTARNTLSVSGNRLFDSLWFTTVVGQVQQNDELDLQLRTVGGGGVGKVLSQTNRRSLAGFVGLVYTRELFTDQPVGNSAELAIGGQFDFFTAVNNDFSLTNSVITYYTSNRVRVETQSAWRHEFLSDFYWSVNGVESFDSHPPETGKRNDFSLSLAVGWKF